MRDVLLYIFLSVFLMAVVAVLSMMYLAYVTVFLMVAMYIPMLCAFIVDKKYLNRGLKNYGLSMPKFDVRYVLLAYVYPLLAVFVGAIIATSLGMKVDWTLSSLTQNLQAVADQATVPFELVLTLFMVQLALAPIINTFLAIGEETGWRGFLLDRLTEEWGLKRAVVVSGIIWGVWHWPVILAIGYNYTYETRFIGIILFVFFTLGWGIFLSWLKVKTRNVWYPALGHGAINAYIGFGTLILGVDRVLGFPAGLLSILAIFVLVIPMSLEFYKEGQNISSG